MGTQPDLHEMKEISSRSQLALNLLTDVECRIQYT